MPHPSDSHGPPGVHLRPVTWDDLSALFEHQRDPEGARMAAVIPRSRAEFDAHWAQLLTSPPPRLVARVIEVAGAAVGMVNRFSRPGLLEEGATAGPDGAFTGELDYVGYWIAREHWGRGIATRALAALLEEVTDRPLHARAARTNVASIRVLRRCGFELIGYRLAEDEGGRYAACEEALLRLDAATHGARAGSTPSHT